MVDLSVNKKMRLQRKWEPSAVAHAASHFMNMWHGAKQQTVVNSEQL
jgi:hypothetical protein